MRTVGILKELAMEKQATRFNLVLYFISICLWMFVISFSIVRLFYNPIMGNGLLLEVSIMSIFICGYLFIKNKKRLDYIKEEEIKIKSNKRYKNNYV